MVYRVLWLPLWRKLSIYMSTAVLTSVIVVIAVRFFSSDMNSEKTFQHMSLAQTPLVALGVLAFCVTVSFAVAMLVRLAQVEIFKEELIGRNYWFIKKRIPLSKITALSPFNNNGIEAIVANGGSYGKIYISIHTENLDSLLAIIEQNMSKQNA